MFLAEDIAKNGLSPSDLPIVTLHDDGVHYLVLEGNRRIAALKILANPNLVKYGSDKSIREKLKKISDDAQGQPLPEKIACVEFPSEEEAAHWLELRHQGQNQGRGVVAWDGQATDRFRERMSGKTSPERQVIEFMRSGGHLGTDVVSRLDSLPITNLKRLLQDPYVRSKVGIEIDQGRVSTPFLKKEIVKGLTSDHCRFSRSQHYGFPHQAQGRQG